MGKRLATMLACVFAAVLFTVPVPAQAATPTEILVGGQDILTVPDHTIVCGQGQATYDKATNTLTLENVKINYQQDETDNTKGAIRFDGDLNIELVGKNSITSATCGIMSAGAGSLTITGEADDSLTVDAVYFGIGSNDGARNVTISGAYVDVDVDLRDPFIGTGIQAGGQLSIVDGATVDVSGSTSETLPVVGNGGVSIVGSNVSARVLADGAYGSGVIVSDDDVVIDGSKVEVSTTATYNFGIRAGNDLTPSEGTIHIKNNSRVNATSGDGMALFTMLGDIQIEDSNVTATSSGHDAVYAIGDILIAGASDVTASGPYPALVATGSIALDPQDAHIDVWSGDAEEDADKIVGSPFTEKVTLGTSSGNYFHCAPHIHEFTEQIVDDAHLASGATCTEAASYYLSCSCGEMGTDTFSIGDSLGHDWGEPAWSWSDDYTEFVATFTCANDPAHTEVLTARPTATVQVEPTCTEPGTMLYSATVELGGERYEATATAEIPATGHDFVDGVCTVCGAEDPDYVKPGKPEPAIPATGDMTTLFSAAPALVGATALAAGTVLRRRR